MSLNLMGINTYKRRRKMTPGLIATLAAPVIIMAIMFGSALLPELSFLAECQNIPGGDICSIALK